MSTESEIINRLKGIFPRIGDDAEEFSITPGFIPVVSVDSFVQGVHFDLSFLAPYDAGYRSCAATLSDIAAMGATPKVLLCAIGLPEGDIKIVESIALGIKNLAKEFNTEVIGGDTVKSDTLFLSLSVIGEARNIVRRGTAEIGDIVCVSSELGGSAAGLKALQEDRRSFKGIIEKYTHPKPQVTKGVILSTLASSMIDISDGLAIDLHHILEESGVGAVIDHIPVDKETEEFARSISQKPEDFALYGGEDFELLFTINEENLNNLKGKMDFIVIGKIVDRGMKLKDGRQIELDGYAHFPIG